MTQLRALRDDADALGYSADTWREMSELGWPGIVIPEAHGGTGFGWQALGVILEETGRTLTASPLYATVLLGAATLLRGGSEAQQSEWLPRVASGEVTLALALEEGPITLPTAARSRQPPTARAMCSTAPSASSSTATALTP